MKRMLLRLASAPIDSHFLRRSQLHEIVPLRIESDDSIGWLGLSIAVEADGEIDRLGRLSAV
jgi:hypothetical protein